MDLRNPRHQPKLLLSDSRTDPRLRGKSCSSVNLSHLRDDCDCDCVAGMSSDTLASVRFLCEIFVVTGLLYLGWEKPFKQWVDQVRGAVTPTVTSAPARLPQAIGRATAPPSGAWARDPNHLTVLDTPAPGYNSGVAAPRPGASVSGSWMWDPNHRSPLDPPAHKSPSPY